jgi:hypothetical protein
LGVESQEIDFPANVLGELQQLEDSYDRITKQFPFGKMLQDAEKTVERPIDIPPGVDKRLRSTISEIKILIDLTLRGVPEKSSR